jgi:hypothetical protein
MGTNIFVRLPSYAELQETSSNLANLTGTELKTASFPSATSAFIVFIGQGTICSLSCKQIVRAFGPPINDLAQLSSSSAKSYFMPAC